MEGGDPSAGKSGVSEKIEYLYLLFTRNGIPWQTANAPYLYKMADMIVTGLPEGITGKEKIRRVTIQFGEYSSMIQEDVIPVWNIQRLELDSIGFPIPCGDHQNYEHSVSLKKHGINHAYLVEDDRNVQSVSQEGERLRIVCKTGEAKNGDLSDPFFPGAEDRPLYLSHHGKRPGRKLCREIPEKVEPADQDQNRAGAFHKGIRAGGLCTLSGLSGRGRLSGQ